MLYIQNAFQFLIWPGIDFILDSMANTQGYTKKISSSLAHIES